MAGSRMMQGTLDRVVTDIRIGPVNRRMDAFLALRREAEIVAWSVARELELRQERMRTQGMVLRGEVLR